MISEVIVPQYGNVKDINNGSTASQIELNHRCIVKTVETLQFLAIQALALRWK